MEFPALKKETPEHSGVFLLVSDSHTLGSRTPSDFVGLRFAVWKFIIEDYWKCGIHEINTDKDHIHILFESKPQVQLSKLVNNYKTVTSRCLRKEFAEELKPYYWKPYFWSDSYFICSVSDRSHAAVEAYIKDQGR